ncbi:MAG: MotA/TolQ/ExbB proton channel family protein [Pseudomonadales bacterium]|nr:MotA/TolQ/ExbB proton channel family protein [Pseudomonadales bacterium]
MWAVMEAFAIVRDFHFAGGVVLWALGIMILIMWTLICERFLFYRFVLPKEINRTMHQWYSRSDRSSWYARQIRQKLIAQIVSKAHFSLPVIKSLVAMCPLFGLLGTVTGMIEIFDVMSAFGMNNTRSMAAGISKATLPTMAGMGGAICGLLAYRMLWRFYEKQPQIMADRLSIPGQVGVK